MDEALYETVLKVCKANPNWQAAIFEAVSTLRVREADTAIERAMEMAVRIVMEHSEP